jgi:tetratricopeptide (TPR) repeat protein
MRNFLYLTYSGGDGENIRASTDMVVDLLEESPPPDLEWQFTFLPDDRHNSSPMKSILGGLELLFSKWVYRGENNAEALATHYRMLTEEFGFECKPSKGAVSARARALISHGNVAEAIKIYRYNATLYPHAPDVHADLGRAYSTAGNREMAIESYERSLELSPENSSLLETLRQLREESGVH